MRRLAIFVALFFVAACNQTPAAEDPPGAGGAGGGTGGAGGDAGPDVEAPTIEVLFDRTEVLDPVVTIGGVARDDRGVERLHWRLGDAPPNDLPAEGMQEAQIAFDVVLAEGENEVVIVAVDAAGNEAEVRLPIRLENPGGRAPAILYYEADRAFAERGEKVGLRWQVIGTRPITTTLHQAGREPVDVTGALSHEIEISAETIEFVRLEVTNPLNSTVGEVGIGVGAELQIYPERAQVAPGEPQPLRARNVAAIEWSADGGRILDGDSHTKARFVADEPGIYTIAGKTIEQPPRTATAIVEVREATVPVDFEGLGAQLALGDQDWRADFDTDGRLWVPTGASGFATFTAAGGWRFVGDEAWPPIHWVSRLQDGALLAGAGGDHFDPATDARVLRLDAGADEWVEAALPLSAAGVIHAGADGTLYRLIDGDSRGIAALAPGAAAWTPLELPEEVSAVNALTTDEAGVLHVAARTFSDVLVLRREGADWVDTGPLDLFGQVSALRFDAAGVLHVAGNELYRLGEPGWEAVEVDPACTRTCAIRDLAVRPDGTLLALSRETAFARQGDGSFAPLGAPLPEMIPDGTGSQGMRHFALAPDGTVALLGEWGTFALAPGATTWSLLGRESPPPGAFVGGMIRATDGTLYVAAGGPRDQFEHELVWARAADGSWKGFGAEAFGSRSFGFSVARIAEGEAGRIYVITQQGRLLLLEADGAPPVELPQGDGFSLASAIALGVSAGGDVHIAVGRRDVVSVYRHQPGAEGWEEIPALAGTLAFVRAPDGTLWASDGASARALPPGEESWTVYAEGLLAPATEVGDVSLAAAEDGTLYLGHLRWGLYRLPPGATAWEGFGAGAPAFAPGRIAVGGGRVWAIADGHLYLVDEERGSLRVDAWLPFDLGSREVHLAVDAEGSAVIGSTTYGLWRGSIAAD